MIFPAPMTASHSPFLRVLSPNNGRGLLVVSCILLLCVGGCNKSNKTAQVNVQKICTFQMSAAESTISHDTRDWNFDLDECVIILDTENEEALED